MIWRGTRNSFGPGAGMSRRVTSDFLSALPALPAMILDLAPGLRSFLRMAATLFCFGAVVPVAFTQDLQPISPSPSPTPSEQATPEQAPAEPAPELSPAPEPSPTPSPEQLPESDQLPTAPEPGPLPPDLIPEGRIPQIPLFQTKPSAEQKVKDAIRFRQLRTMASRHPNVIAWDHQAKLARTEYGKREALKQYYQWMGYLMQQKEPRLKPMIDGFVGPALSRLAQTRIEPTVPPVPLWLTHER
jgi:hypothetical protein